MGDKVQGNREQKKSGHVAVLADGQRDAAPKYKKPRMDTVCKPDSERAKNSKKHCKIKPNSSLIATNLFTTRQPFHWHFH
jgi:hypothetical protein